MPKWETANNCGEAKEARRIVNEWNAGGPMAHNIAGFGLQMLATGNKQLANEVHEYLKSECGY